MRQKIGGGRKIESGNKGNGERKIGENISEGENMTVEKEGRKKDRG